MYSPMCGPLRLFPEWSMLRSMRVRWGLSQEELAAEVGATRRTISSIERRRASPSLSLAVALARRLDLAVEELFPLDDLR